MYKKLKIIVRTPRDQAKPCMVKQRDALLGFKKQKKILEEKLIAHNEFYWIIPADDQADEYMIMRRLAKGEINIKQFYKTLMKMLDRANKLAAKFKKGTSWIKRWIVKRLKKQEQHDFVEQVEAMSYDEIKDFVRIDDRKEMVELLEGSLIDVVEVK